MKALATLFAFNRGLVSQLALARQDLKRMALSADIQTNWMPRVLGSMMLRPGSTFLHSTHLDARVVHIPFVFSATDTALVEMTPGIMRVIVNNAPVTRGAVGSAIVNGAFNTDLTGWTDVDEAGATSVWAAGGYLSLTGDAAGIAYAGREQLVTLAGAGEHALAIRVFRGTARLRVGSVSNGEQYATTTTLRQGYHSIAFTPTTDFYVRIEANDTTATLIDNINIEAAGAMALVTPYADTEFDQLQGLRYEQSGDVIFLAQAGARQQRVERQAVVSPTAASRSWSIVEYIPEDGPFRNENTSRITMQVSALTGSGVTLTASEPYFRSTNVGSLFRLASSGQIVSDVITPPVVTDTFTGEIRVTGVGTSRAYGITVTGITGGSVTLQRSIGASGDWADYATYTADLGTTTGNDGLDNQIIYYRLGVRAGNGGATPITVALTYDSGSIQGVGLVTGFTSSTVVTLDVLTAFGGTKAADSWWEGQWSDRRGWPSAVALYDGRLFWAGKDSVNGSVSDAFSTFADATVGDAGPIKRGLGSGPVDTANWILPLQRLLIGTQAAELVVKSTSFDEPLTPTQFSIKAASTLGSASARAVQLDSSGVYIQRSGLKVYELVVDPNTYGYTSNDLTSIIPEIGLSQFKRIAVQRQPDTRIHFVRGDGKVAILVFDPLEKVTCWVLYEPAGWTGHDTGARVEDAVVLPGLSEDAVYYCVNRTIGGVTKRYLEKWALESQARNGTSSIISDCTKVFPTAPAGPLAGLDHLEGETVCVWGNAKDLGTQVVTGGSINLPEASTLAYVGLPYEATFRSAKLSLGSATGNALTQRQRLDHVGLVLADTHAQGLRFGQDVDHLDDLPLIEQGAPIDVNSIHGTYSEDSIELNGVWNNDTRLVLKAASPRACTVLACVISGAGHDKG